MAEKQHTSAHVNTLDVATLTKHVLATDNRQKNIGLNQ